MREPAPDVTGFRRRLRQLIEARYDGKYTHLARRADLAVSTLEHYLHQAKKLPGGAHLLRLAAALGVSAEYLGAGQDRARSHAAHRTRRAESLPRLGGSRSR